MSIIFWLNSLFCFVGLFTFCYSNLEIIRGPQSVSNATLGSTVRFDCQISDPLVSPRWNINGRDYRISDLPLGHEYVSQMLIIYPVKASMNNSVYYCYVFDSTSEGVVEVKSSRAMLIIPPLHTEYSSIWRTASWQERSILYPSITSLLSSTSTNSTINLPQHSSVGVIFIAVAAVIVLLATFSVITLALVVYVREKGKIHKGKRSICRISTNKSTFEGGSKYPGKEHPVYEEINTTPSVQHNPAYETPLSLKVNLAYESVNKPPPEQADHVYDVIKELQKSY